MTRRGLLLGLYLAGVGCAHRTYAPPAPGPSAPLGSGADADVTMSDRLRLPGDAPATPQKSGSLKNVDLYLADLTVHGASHSDGPRDLERLQHRLAEYLVARTPFRSVQRGTPGPGRPGLHLAAELYVEHSSMRTFILDYLSLYLGGLFAPTWGQAEVHLQVRLADGRGQSIVAYSAAAWADFSAAWWSWYRTDYVEDAYAEAYQHVFSDVATQLAADADKIATLLGPPAEVGEAPPVDPFLLPEPAPPEPRFGIIAARASAFDGTVLGALHLLGGVEGAALHGFAQVTSSVEDGQGVPVDVAAGSAKQKGYRIALYSAPTKTGWFWYPVVGFLTQDISIADFRGAFAQQSGSNDTNIEATCSNPDTSEVIDCDSPNVYGLEMRSGYAGARGGYSVVAGSPNIELFVSANLGVNALEYRSIRAEVGSHSAAGNTWAVLRSGAFGATYGFRLPKLHVALRGIIDYEWYQKFAYAEPVLFKGPVVFNASKSVFEQPPLFVKAAKLQSWSFQIAGAITF